MAVIPLISVCEATIGVVIAVESPAMVDDGFGGVANEEEDDGWGWATVIKKKIYSNLMGLLRILRGEVI